MLHSYRARATSPGQRARHRRFATSRRARITAYANRSYRLHLSQTPGTRLALYNPALIRKPLSLRAVLAGAR